MQERYGKEQTKITMKTENIKKSCTKFIKTKT